MKIPKIVKTVTEKLNEAKDPICRMKVDLEKTKYTSTYQGKIYGFCSEECKGTFDKNPYKYAEANC